jgi:hypothetical protein
VTHLSSDAFFAPRMRTPRGLFGPGRAFTTETEPLTLSCRHPSTPELVSEPPDPLVSDAARERSSTCLGRLAFDPAPPVRRDNAESRKRLPLCAHFTESKPNESCPDPGSLNRTSSQSSRTLSPYLSPCSTSAELARFLPAIALCDPLGALQRRPSEDARCLRPTSAI